MQVSDEASIDLNVAILAEDLRMLIMLAEVRKHRKCSFADLSTRPYSVVFSVASGQFSLVLIQSPR